MALSVLSYRQANIIPRNFKQKRLRRLDTLYFRIVFLTSEKVYTLIVKTYICGEKVIFFAAELVKFSSISP